jgi:hypothetical protein
MVVWVRDRAVLDRCLCLILANHSRSTNADERLRCVRLVRELQIVLDIDIPDGGVEVAPKDIHTGGTAEERHGGRE